MKQSYRDLQIWRKAIELSTLIYRLTESFPQREHYGLAAHIRKTVVSVASNIAEGSARYSNKEFGQFLLVARSSPAELHTQLLIAAKLAYISKSDFNSVMEKIDELGRMINALRNKLTTND